MSDTVDRMGKYVDFESQLRSRINDDSFYSIPVNERGNYVAGLIEGFSKINNLNEDDKDYIGKLAEEQLTDFRISNNIPRFVPTQEQAAELFDRFPDTSTDERVEDVERKVDAWKASSLAKASALRPAEREDIETYLNRSSNNFIREEAARLNDTGWFMDKGYRAVEELAKPFHQLLDPDGSDRFWAKSAPENPSYDQDFTSLIAGGIGQVIPQIAISIGLTAAGSPEAIPAVFTALYGAEYMQNGYREEFARSGDEGKAWDNAVSQIPAALLETVGDTLLVRGVTKTARQFGKEFASASTMEAKKAILREALPTMGKAAKEGFIAEAFVGGMAAEWASGYGSYLATGDENYLRSTKDIIKGGLAEGIVGGLTAGLLHGVTNDSTRKAFAQDVSTLTGLKVKQEEIYAALKNGDFQKVIDITNKDIITDPAQQDATLDVVDKARAAINGKPITEEEKAATPKASSLVIPSTTRVKIRQDIENIDKELSDPSVTEERSNELNKRKQYLTDVNEKINNGTYEELNEVKGTVDTTSVYRNHEAIGKNDKGLTTQEITLDNGERFSYTTDDIPVFLQSNTFKQTLNGIVARFGQENVTVDLAATSGNAVIKWTEDGKKKHSQGFPYTRTPRKGFTPLTLNENGTLKIHNPINEIKYAGNARNIEVITDDTVNNIITVKNKKGETITLDGERANTLRASIPNYKPEEVAKEKAEDTKPKEKKASVVDNSAQEKLTFERGNVPIVADGERRFLHKETNKMGVVVKDNGTLLFKPDDNSTPIELGGAESQITLNDAGLTRELDVRTPTEVDTNDIVDILEHEQIQSEKQSKPTTTVDKKAATKRFNDFINEFKSKFNSNSAQAITQAFNLQKNLLSRLFDLGIEVSVIDSSESIANSHAYHSEGKIYFVADRVNEAYPEGAPVALFELGLIHESAHAGTYLLEKQDPALYISAKENFLQNKELNDLMVAEYPGYETLSEDNKFYEGVRAIIEGRLKGRTTGLAKGGKFAEFLNKLLNYIRNTLFTSRDKIVFQFVSNVEDVLGVTPSVEFANNNITVNGIPSNIVSDFATIVYTKPNSEGISELISSYSRENLRLLAGMMRLNQSGTKQDLIDRIVSYKPVSENPFSDNSIMESRSQPLDAGGGFVFLMAEPTLDNKIGKHTIPRNGIVSEELFQKIGTGTSEIIPAHELAFYKELVPNAFTKEGVDLFALYDGLKEANNSISVFTYGQEADSPERRLQAELTHNWLEKLSSEKQLAYRGSPDFTKYPSYLEELRKQGFSDDDLLKAQQLQKVSRLVSEEKDSGLRATSYYNQISPFDTKKFPPVRIDVVLPNYNTSVDNLHTNIKGTVVWSMVQIVPHPRTGKKVAFIAELQSLAAQARRDQMKSLKSSIEQIEDRVKNGNLDRTAADKLIQSQKDAADAIAPDHPVLPVHQSLGLKAVIKWVKEQNQKAIAEGRPEDVIDEVAVSDGETAMMTEGHDKAAERTYQESDIGKWSVRDSVTNREYNIYPTKANAELQAKDIQTRTGNPQVLKEITKEDTALRVSQEGGMRLAYDVTLPSIAKKLTRDNGTAMDFGPHKNAQKEETFDEVRAREAAGWSSEAGFPSLTPETKLVGSPVFRNPDGTPKSSATALVYTLNNVQRTANLTQSLDEVVDSEYKPISDSSNTNIINNSQPIIVGSDFFADSGKFYRVIQGDESLNDILQSGEVRTNAAEKIKSGMTLAEKMAARPTAFPSFSKGSASMSYAAENPNHSIIVTADKSLQPSTSGRHSAGKTHFPTVDGVHQKSLGNNFQVYKHIGNGEYELVFDKGMTGEIDNAPFSLAPRSQQDTEYLAAVEAGDMEKAQRMVRTAKEDYEKSIARKPIPLRTVPERLSGKIKPEDTTTLQKIALKIKERDQLRATINSGASGYSWAAYEKRSDNITAALEGIFSKVRDERGVRDVDIAEKWLQDSWVAQTKSADPVTYDESGNVIPLSQRFDSTNNNIQNTQPIENIIDEVVDSEYEHTDTVLGTPISPFRKTQIERLNKLRSVKIEALLSVEDKALFKSIKAIKALAALNDDVLAEYVTLYEDFISTRSNNIDAGISRPASSELINKLSSLTEKAKQAWFEEQKDTFPELAQKDFQKDFQGKMDYVNDFISKLSGMEETTGTDKVSKNKEAFLAKIDDLRAVINENYDQMKEDLFSRMDLDFKESDNPHIQKGIELMRARMNDSKEWYGEFLNHLLNVDVIDMSAKNVRNTYYALMSVAYDGYVMNTDGFVSSSINDLLADSEGVVPLNTFTSTAAARVVPNLMSTSTKARSIVSNKGYIALQKIASNFRESLKQSHMMHELVLVSYQKESIDNAQKKSGKRYSDSDLQRIGIYAISRRIRIGFDVKSEIERNISQIKDSILVLSRSGDKKLRRASEWYNKYIDTLFDGVLKSETPLETLESNAVNAGIDDGMKGYVNDIVNFFDAFKPIAKFTKEFIYNREFIDEHNYVPTMILNLDESKGPLQYNTDDVTLNMTPEDTSERNVNTNGMSGTFDRSARLKENQALVFNINHLFSNRGRLNFLDAFSAVRRKEISTLLNAKTQKGQEMRDFLGDEFGGQFRYHTFIDFVKTQWKAEIESVQYIHQYQSVINGALSRWGGFALSSVYQGVMQLTSNIAPFMMANIGNPQKISAMFKAYDYMNRHRAGLLTPQQALIYEKVLFDVAHRHQDQVLDTSVNLGITQDGLWQAFKSSAIANGISKVDKIIDKVKFFRR